ncbi:MAG TPA: serine/threonine-protein kinase [Gemmataceae bacterium]|nr:serine/threonine-protein kinase [Gemmataceae bacterium]
MSSSAVCLKCARPLLDDTTPRLCPVCQGKVGFEDCATLPAAELPTLPDWDQASRATAGDDIRSAKARLPFGDYELLAEIARGGMGVVYKALHLRLNRIVALKMIRDPSAVHPDSFVRFLGEAEAVARVRHPHIAQIFEVGDWNGQPYYTMEFVEGGTLAQKCAHAPMAHRQAGHLIEMLARAIHAAHNCGIIHRDLKPSNVLLAADDTPRITDFGLAKRLEGGSGLTQTGEILGTPSYMAPEQAEGRTNEIGPLTDVYALGAILYELLTGRPPFVGVTILDVLDQVKSQEPLPFTRLRIYVPRDLETICLKCLQKEPAKRYASAEELADDLQRFLDGRPIVARPIGMLASIWLWCHRPERVREAGVYAVAMGVVLFCWALHGLVWLGIGWMPQARPAEVVVSLTGLILLAYCPTILIGLGAMSRKVISLWLGVLFFSSWLVITQVLLYQDPLHFTFDFGGIYTSWEIRAPTFALLSLIILVGVLLFAVALLAYYSNRDLMRGPYREVAKDLRHEETTLAR